MAVDGTGQGMAVALATIDMIIRGPVKALCFCFDGTLKVKTAIALSQVTRQLTGTANWGEPTYGTTIWTSRALKISHIRIYFLLKTNEPDLMIKLPAGAESRSHELLNGSGLFQNPTT